MNTCAGGTNILEISYTEMENIIEAVLFAGGEPVDIADFAKLFDVDAGEMRKIIVNYADKYNSVDRGLEIAVIDDKVQMLTRQKYALHIGAVLGAGRKKQRGISKQALEILAIVAYNQPVTKGYIEQVRGVESGYIVNTLAEKGFIKPVGRLDIPGRPQTYGTTEKFLRYFGLSSTADLPDAGNFGGT